MDLYLSKSSQHPLYRQEDWGQDISFDSEPDLFAASHCPMRVTWSQAQDLRGVDFFLLPQRLHESYFAPDQPFTGRADKHKNGH